MTDIKRITLSSLAAATLLASGAGTALAADYPVHRYRRSRSHHRHIFRR